MSAKIRASLLEWLYTQPFLCILAAMAFSRHQPLLSRITSPRSPQLLPSLVLRGGKRLPTTTNICKGQTELNFKAVTRSFFISSQGFSSTGTGNTDCTGVGKIKENTCTKCWKSTCQSQALRPQTRYLPGELCPQKGHSDTARAIQVSRVWHRESWGLLFFFFSIFY